MRKMNKTVKMYDYSKHIPYICSPRFPEKGIQYI
jgi:hypothetical protein